MNATSLAPVTKLARSAAVLLTLGLFTIGSIPAAGQAFPDTMHWVAHLAAYALIAFAYGLGWPLQMAAQIAGIVAAIGAIQKRGRVENFKNNPQPCVQIVQTSVGLTTVSRAGRISTKQ